jgi:hypothetical protein
MALDRNLHAGVQRLTIDVSSLAEGAYILRIEAEEMIPEALPLQVLR